MNSQLGGNPNQTTGATAMPQSCRPSFPSVRGLQKIMIKDLRRDVRHTDNYIKLRSTSDRRVSTVEDENGDTIMIRLYHQEAGDLSPTRYTLPIESTLIIKDPQLKALSKGNYGLRVDHRSDLLYVIQDGSPASSHRRLEMEDFGVSAEEVRRQGNDYFNAYDYQAAIKIYSRALQLTSDEKEIETLKLNRALAHIRVKNFDAALIDLEPMASVSKPGEKALYRKARALYSLQRFEECYEVLTTLISEYPENTEAQKEMLRATKRVEEQKSGTYDFKKMYKAAETLRPPLLDRATYIGPVVIKDAGTRGQGLFTNRAVKAGDLLFCEKAFAYAYVGEEGQQTQDQDDDEDQAVLFNLQRYSVPHGTTSKIIQMTFQKMHQDPSFTSTIMDLYYGVYSSTNYDPFKSTPVIGSMYIRSAIGAGSYACPLTSRQNHLRKVEEMVNMTTKKQSIYSGVWALASKINHSCYRNAQSAYIGDMMIVRATRDLPPGAEITFWHHPPEREANAARQMKLACTGRSCDCVMCLDDQATDSSIFNSREQQRTEIGRLSLAGALRAKTPRIESIVAAMESQYRQPASEVPRLHVWDLHLILAQIYIQRQDPYKAIISARKALSSLGYVIDFRAPQHETGASIVITQWGLFEEGCIDCWGILSSAYRLVAPHFEPPCNEYVKLFFRICVGEDDTFEETLETIRQKKLGGPLSPSQELFDISNLFLF